VFFHSIFLINIFKKILLLLYLFCLDVPRASDLATCWSHAVHVLNIHMCSLDSRLPHSNQHRPPVQAASVSVCTVWPALTVQPHCSFSVTTCVTCSWSFVCETPRAFDLWLGYWQWLAVTIDWLLTVTDSDHWLVTDSDWQWSLTGYWRWFTVTIDWLLTVTGSDNWLVTDGDWQWPLTGYWLTIDWLLTGTGSDHWPVTDSDQSKPEPLTRNTPTDDRKADVAGQGNASELRP
jgi:hypothetical protein